MGEGSPLPWDRAALPVWQLSLPAPPHGTLLTASVRKVQHLFPRRGPGVLSSGPVTPGPLSQPALLWRGVPDLPVLRLPSRDIEIFALFISCMCHDLDHRGTNNSFQVASVRPDAPPAGHPPPGVWESPPSNLRPGAS